MFALAVLLLVAAAALILWVVFGLAGQSNNQIHFSGFGIDADLSPITLFCLGALALLLIWAATRLIAAGTRRKYHQHKETKQLKKEHAQLEKERLEAERKHEVEHDRRETAEARQHVAERDVERYEEDKRVEGAYARPAGKGGSDNTAERVTTQKVTTTTEDLDEPAKGRHYLD